MSTLLRFFVFVLAALAGGSRVFAYSLTGSHWTGSSTTMQLQLGASSGTLSDGFSSWGASAEDALNTWNGNLSGFRFAVVRDSTATRAEGNRSNNVFFSGDIYGDAWGANVLAVTLTYTVGSANTETDVLFNSRLTWNSYRGALRYSSTGAGIYDFHRVAMHEFGHVLGLDHPDENGQSVAALMNSRISSLDTLAADDIAGARALYGSSAPVVALPTITAQPVSRTVTAGQSTSFSVTATSTAALSYQWLKNNVALTGATDATLSLASAATVDAGTYAALVTNSAGSVLSTGAVLTVNAPVASVPVTATPAPTTPAAPTAPAAPTTTSTPVVIAPGITTQPVSQSAGAGGAVSFTIAANGTAPFSYQWRKNGTAIPGANAATLTLANVQNADAASYSVAVWNAAGLVVSNAATLTVNSAPTIVAPPVDQTATLGAKVSFNVTASGSPTLSYRWRKDGADVAGANGATLTIDSVQLSHAGSYAVVVSNAGGSVTSATARLSVIGVPVIAAQPVPQTATVGGSTTFSVTATSLGPVSYQWLRNGAEISGATGSTFTIDSVRPTDAADYSVRITNASGSVASSAARLAVNFSRLTNLSTRGFVPAGGALTPGFYVRGAAAKSLLIRAVGPTLSLFGVGSALGEAKLDVIAQDSATVVASNQAWSANAALSSVFASVGAFPLAADSKDAAVQTSLLPRSYTVRVTPGEPAMSGITLAEIYDVDTLVGTDSQLVNVSTLGFVGSGDNVLTAGFAISGNAPKRLLIRAVGPGLAQFGVGGVLSDPQLGLVPLGRTEPIATNDDWPDTANVRTAFAAAGAFGLAAGSKDAALVITLEPGAYTVIVSGVNGAAAGQALVEIYDLDP